MGALRSFGSSARRQVGMYVLARFTEWCHYHLIIMSRDISDIRYLIQQAVPLFQEQARHHYAYGLSPVLHLPSRRSRLIHGHITKTLRIEGLGKILYKKVASFPPHSPKSSFLFQQSPVTIHNLLVVLALSNYRLAGSNLVWPSSN